MIEHPGKGCRCPEVHKTGSWCVVGHSIVNKVRSTQDHQSGSVHYMQETLRASVNHSPGTRACLGLQVGSPRAQQMQTAANGGRADRAMKKTCGPFERQLVSKGIALEVEYF